MQCRYIKIGYICSKPRRSHLQPWAQHGKWPTMSPVLLCCHQLILGLKLRVQNHNQTLHKLTNPSEEAKGFKGPLSVLLKLFRHCQVGVSFRTTESDLDHSLKLGLKFYEKNRVGHCGVILCHWSCRSTGSICFLCFLGSEVLLLIWKHWMSLWVAHQPYCYWFCMN